MTPLILILTLKTWSSLQAAGLTGRKLGQVSQSVRRTHHEGHEVDEVFAGRIIGVKSSIFP
jgi:hypothetical protein